MKWGWSLLQRRQQAHSRKTLGVIQEAIKCSPGYIKKKRALWAELSFLIFQPSQYPAAFMETNETVS